MELLPGHPNLTAHWMQASSLDSQGTPGRTSLHHAHRVHTEVLGPSKRQPQAPRDSQQRPPQASG